MLLHAGSFLKTDTNVVRLGFEAVHTQTVGFLLLQFQSQFGPSFVTAVTMSIKNWMHNIMENARGDILKNIPSKKWRQFTKMENEHMHNGISKRNKHSFISKQ